MFGGDEVSSLVFDFGTYNYRVGYSGEDSPKCVFQPVVGISGSSHYYSEANLRYYKDNTKVSKFMNEKTGHIENYYLFEETLNNLINESLYVDLKDHPILFSEPSLHNKEQRRQLAEFMFEKYQIPALYICKNAVLSSFSCGRGTCLVFDSGHNFTYSVPVYEGFCLQKSLLRTNIAGNYITNLLKKKMEEKHISLVPFYRVQKIKKREVTNSNNLINNSNNQNSQVNSNTNSSVQNTSNSNIVYETKVLNSLKTDPSYEEFWQNDIVTDLKETCLMTCENQLPYNPDTDQFTETSMAPPISYDLPDGNTVELVEDRILLVERVFNQLKSHPGFNGYHQLIIDAINKSDLDIRKDLYGNIFVCGGNTLFPSFAERLQKQLYLTVSQNIRLKIITHPSNTEKKFSTWIGGSILSSLGTFHQLWLSKQEFEEHGGSILERKCA